MTLNMAEKIADCVVEDPATARPFALVSRLGHLDRVAGFQRTLRKVVSCEHIFPHIHQLSQVAVEGQVAQQKLASGNVVGVGAVRPFTAKI